MDDQMCVLVALRHTTTTHTLVTQGNMVIETYREY